MLEKIIQECPKAWAEFCGWLEYEPREFCTLTWHKSLMFAHLNKEPIFYNFRDWYNYLDDLGIRVHIRAGWDYYIETRGEVTENNFCHPTRIEAEWQAFYEAFKLRESQLCS